MSVYSVPVEDVIVAKINWGSSEVRKYKAKYRQEKERVKNCKAWFEREMKVQQLDLERERDAADTELRQLKRETKKDLESLTKQMLDMMFMSETEKDDSDRSPTELLSALAQRQKTVEARVAQLQLQRQEKEKEVAALKECFEEEKAREQEKVVRFVLSLEERDKTVLNQLAVGVETPRILQVAERLLQEHNIRLLAMDCGLSFLMEAPRSQWMSLTERQLSVKAMLNDLFSEDVASFCREVTAECHDDADIPLGQPLKVAVVSEQASSEQHARHSSLRTVKTEFKAKKIAKVKPVHMFSVRPFAADDQKIPLISSIVCVGRGRLVLADSRNKKVKVMGVNSVLDTATMVDSLTLTETPARLAALSDDEVAASTAANVIYILKIINERIRVL
jgi:hypothetical protein